LSLPTASLHSDEHPIAGRVTNLVAKKAVALATWIEEAINKTRACKLSRPQYQKAKQLAGISIYYYTTSSLSSTYILLY